MPSRRTVGSWTPRFPNYTPSRIAPSAIHKLNRAVAVAEWKGAAAGLAVLDGFEPPAWLAGSYIWPAVMADLHRRRGDAQVASGYRTLAFNAAPTPAVKELLQRRLQIDNVGRSPE